MLFTNRRVANAILWILNHTPFLKHDFEVIAIKVNLEPTEAEWTAEQRMALHEILDKDDE